MPLLRGKSRSRSAAAIMEECRGLLARGVPEIWIVGTHLEDWGGGSLPELLDRVGETCAENGGRVRMGSLGIDALSEELLLVVARRRAVCRHFHLSLQSGSARIRRRMGRRRTPDEARARVARVRELLPGATFSGDVLVGFPGEEEEDFAATCALAREIGFVKMHIFPFSPRPGTRAVLMEGRVPAAVVAERCARLAALERELFTSEAGKLIGQTLGVVVERVGETAEGVAEEYVRVRFPRGESRKGELRRVRARDVRGQVVYGEIVP